VIDTSIGAFVTRHKFTVKLRVYFYITILLHDASRTLDHNFTRIFKEMTKLDVLEIYHGTGYYTIFELGIDLSPNESLRVIAVCTRIITAKMYKTSLQLSFCTLESRDPGHQKLSISN